MTDDQLADGVYLQGELAKLRRKIERISNPHFSIQLLESNNLSHSSSLIATVGVGENCEHDLAPLATALRDNAIAHYEAQLQALEAKYAAL